MVTRSAPAPVATPAPQPVRTGLLRSADNRSLLSERWETGGVAYRPNSSVPGQSFDPCATNLVVTPDTAQAVEWTPWGVALSSDCFAASTDQTTEEARVTERYRSQISHLVEETFWTGNLDDGSSFTGNGWENRPLASLASDDLTAGGPIGVVPAFREAFEYLASAAGGLRGMIHVPINLIPYISFYGLGIREPNFLVLTNLGDHIIVPGTGYPGTAPDGSPAEGGTTWIYITSLVRAAATDPIVTSDLSRQGGDNHWKAVAQGLALAEWDLAAHGAIQVCVPDPGPDCTPGVS